MNTPNDSRRHDPAQGEAASVRSTRRRLALGLGLGSALLFAGGALFATGGGPRGGGGRPWFHLHGHGARHGGEAFSDAAIRGVLAEAGVDAARAEKVTAILRAAAGKVHQKDPHQELHKAALGLLSRSSLDRDALEKLRRDAMASFEESSRTIADAVAEAFDVLTPDERQRLVEKVRQRGPHGG